MAETQAVGRTDAGRQRQSNEDSFGIFAPTLAFQPALYIVADGMGGHAAGEVASALAVEQVAAAFKREASLNLTTRIQQAIHLANTAIIHAADDDATRQGMGSTIVCAVIQGNQLVSAHVGDSRLYRVRGASIDRLTVDHSMVEEQVRAGLLSDEEAQESTNRNVITRALGTGSHVDVETSRHVVQPGDVYLLCTDGLSNLVADTELQRTVTALPPQQACERLVHMANERGGPDNITALVVHIDSTSAPAAGADGHTSGASSSRVGKVPVLPDGSPWRDADQPAVGVPATRRLTPSWYATWVLVALIAIALILVFQDGIRTLLFR